MTNIRNIIKTKLRYSIRNTMYLGIEKQFNLLLLSKIQDVFFIGEWKLNVNDNLINIKITVKK